MSTATPVINSEDLSVEQIFTDEDWQDILDRILYINLDTAGVDMVDIILRQIENALRRKDDDDGVQNIFTRLAASNGKFGKIIPELENLYQFESTDQAGNISPMIPFNMTCTFSSVNLKWECPEPWCIPPEFLRTHPRLWTLHTCEPSKIRQFDSITMRQPVNATCSRSVR